MSIIILVYFILCLSGIKFARSGEIFTDYMSKEKTSAINGIFTILVIFRHIGGYVSYNGAYDSWYNAVNGKVSQLIVTTFLLYSGYGVMESIKKRGPMYIKSLPVKRALKLLIHFDLAVILFIITNQIISVDYSISDTLLAFTSWTSVGNSTWYVFAILYLYIITWLAFSIFKKNYYIAAALVSLLCIPYISIIWSLKEGTWVNTIFCYPLGIIYSLCHEYIEKLLSGKKFGTILYSLSLTSCLIVFFLAYERRLYRIWFHEIWAMAFCGLVVLLTMRVQIYNGMLSFLGKHVFSIYILQRIPMRIFTSQLINLSGQRYMFFFMSLTCTITLAIIFDFLTNYIDQILFDKNKSRMM